MPNITTYKKQLSHLALAENKAEKVRFTVYLFDNYGVPRSNSRRNIRRASWEEWKCHGLIGCVAEYLGRTDITTMEQVYAWFDALPKQNVPCNNVPAEPIKMRFYEYMSERGICRDTICRRLCAKNVTEWEAKGLKAIYDEFCQIQRKR